MAIPSKVIYQGVDYKVTKIGDNAFEAKGLTGVDIPHTVTRIEKEAFLGNNLTEVVIPLRVNSIGASAFQDNPNLKTVIVRSHDAPSLGSGAFSDRGQIGLLVPRQVTTLSGSWLDGLQTLRPRHLYR